MARHSPSAIVTVTLIFLFVAAYSSAPVVGIGGLVGGRTKIDDVETNKEVQKLGKYSVGEYNRQRRQDAEANGGDLTFAAVVEAEKQVVSGFKYYLKISAVTKSGVPKTFDAVVVVKPWVKSKELINFEPVTKTT